MIENNENLDLKLKFLEEEIEIRVECLRNELDNFLGEFKTDLKILKENFIS